MGLAGFKYVVTSGLLLALGLAAQAVHELTPVPRPTGSYVAFKFDWDEGHPWRRYTIAVDDAGKAHFDGVGNPSDSGDGDAYQQEFAMTDANRQKIFDLSRKLGYFQGNYEAKQKNIARTGQKTLEYHGLAAGGGQMIEHSSSYNYSTNSDVQELTRFFQAIATTVDYGRKLEFQYRFDKLGMDARLNSLQDMVTSHNVEELQAIEPVLQKIAGDPNMMHINRVVAKQLLKSLPDGGGPIHAPIQP
jgi:hypothetical protein